MLRKGADVVIVLAHSGATPVRRTATRCPNPENFAGVLAEEVPGIDAIFAGALAPRHPQHCSSPTR
jgi:2',3'-cyclic-nucleotide 2'-phosphodiesterase / 3'-nucleotidase